MSFDKYRNCVNNFTWSAKSAELSFISSFCSSEKYNQTLLNSTRLGNLSHPRVRQASFLTIELLLIPLGG